MFCNDRSTLAFKCLWSAIKKRESDSSLKTLIILQNLYKCCCFELSIYQRIMKENVFHKYLTILNISNVSCKSSHKMVFQGSCDTEDWSNDNFRFTITGINYI